MSPNTLTYVEYENVASQIFKCLKLLDLLRFLEKAVSLELSQN